MFFFVGKVRGVFFYCLNVFVNGGMKLFVGMFIARNWFHSKPVETLMKIFVLWFIVRKFL